MADTKISDLTAVTDVQGTDEFVLARAGVTNKIDAADLFSGCRVVNATFTHTPSGSGVAVTFTSESFDTDTYHDNSTNNTRLTVPATGYYLVVADGIWDSNGTNAREIYIRANGAATKLATDFRAANVASNGMNVSAIIQLSATEYVEMIAVQNSGANRLIDCKFAITKLPI